MIIMLFAAMLQGAPVPVPAASPKVDAGQQKICRKYVETGSLVRATKVCRTRAEWRRSEEEAREEGRQLQNNPNPNQGG